MAGQAVTIADAVVTAINAKNDYSNSYTPTAVRKMLFNAKIDRESTTSVGVYVMPGPMTAIAEDEGVFAEAYQTRVFVFDEVDKSSDSNDYNETTVSNLLTLVEEIQTQIVTYADTNPSTLKFTGTYENNPLLDDEFIRDGVFLSVTNFTFRNYRSV